MAHVTVEGAEAAWIDAMASSRDALVAMLHPEFVAVHGPVGFVHDRDQFAADVARRPPAVAVSAIDSRIREFGDTAIVTCIQEMHIGFDPDLPPFVIQAAVTRVWMRTDGVWKLVHLQMARRLPPG